MFLSYDQDRGSRGSRCSKGSRGSKCSRGSTPSYPSNPSNPWLKNKERKDALYAGCPCRALDVWDAHTQGDASLCPGLCACYPFRVLTWQYDERTRFIYFCLTSTTELIRLIRGRKRIQRTRKVYPCLSPCDGCKDPKG